MRDSESLVAELTLEEKARLCVGSGPWTTASIERLGIPAVVLSDGPHGVRRVENLGELASRSRPATCFPTASSLASSWNPDLLVEVGAAIGAEARALGVNVVLGPGNNMKRTPLCGRNFEYFSEDPHLSGELVVRYIEGLQSRGVGAALKHYAANNQEFQRFSISAEVDERTLHEIYLAAFETAVRRARPWTVMCAYNKLNGTYLSEHRELLTGILRDAWGFDGLVMSDWGAVHDRVASLEAGLDLEMPGPKPRRVRAVIDAVERGDLDEGVLDTAVRRVLDLVRRATEASGERGAPASSAPGFDLEAHHALARRAAGEGVVLLKNDGTLPLAAPASVAVIGRAAVEPRYQGGGSSHINPTRLDAPLDELRRLAPDTEFRYAEGYPAGLERDQALVAESVASARDAEVVLVFAALPGAIESEGYDRLDLELTPQQVELIRAVSDANPKTVVVLNSGSAVTMGAWLDGVAAVLQAWLMGQAGGGAVADVLLGRIEPSGRLAETFPDALLDTPAYLNYPGENGRVRYGEGLFIGYRYYDAKRIAPRFPFGHGLGYTTFGYRDLRLSSDAFRDRDGLRVSVAVTNTGDRAGHEVAQLYVRDPEAALVRPPKELKGFAKVWLEPGETTTVTFELDARAFAYYHPGYGRWITESGEVEILVGASAADIRLRASAMLASTLDLPSLLNRESTVRHWLDDPRGRAAVGPILEDIAAAFGADPDANDDEGGIGMDPTGFIMDMPLLSVFHFQQDSLDASPEDRVEALLARVQAQA